jgi:hypothetical protein
VVVHIQLLKDCLDQRAGPWNRLRGGHCRAD